MNYSALFFVFLWLCLSWLFFARLAMLSLLSVIFRKQDEVHSNYFFSLFWLLVLHWYASNVLVQYMNVMELKITVSKLIVIILMILIRVMSAIITEVALYLVRVSTEFSLKKAFNLIWKTGVSRYIRYCAYASPSDTDKCTNEYGDVSTTFFNN